jgi:uncharacterized membrane-anchored protein
MENNSREYTLLSLLSGLLSWITIQNAQYLLSFVASIIAIGSGIMALRYYYYAGNLKKKQLKSDKDGD